MSHHQLGAFLSNQDLKMVQQEGADTNCFVSLVVDTKGSYVAIITRKVQSKTEVIVQNLNSSYEFFGEGSIEVNKQSPKTTTKIVENEIIEYFDLNVERQEVSNSLEYLDHRFEEINEKKKLTKTTTPWNFSNIDSITDLSKWTPDKTSSYQELDLFKPYEDTKLNTSFQENIDYEWTPDPEKIHQAVISIILGTTITNPTKVNLKQWIANQMVNTYNSVFGEYTEQGSSDKFDEWKDFIIQYTLDYYNDLSCTIDDLNLCYQIVAQAIMDELNTYERNPYIDAYCETLNWYIKE